MKMDRIMELKKQIDSRTTLIPAEDAQAISEYNNNNKVHLKDRDTDVATWAVNREIVSSSDYHIYVRWENLIDNKDLAGELKEYMERELRAAGYTVTDMKDGSVKIDWAKK